MFSFPVAIRSNSMVDSFNRNITDLSFLANRLVSKQLDLLQQLTPGTASIGVLVNPTNPTLAGSFWREAQEAADTLGVQVHLLHAPSKAAGTLPPGARPISNGRANRRGARGASEGSRPAVRCSRRPKLECLPSGFAYGPTGRISSAGYPQSPARPAATWARCHPLTAELVTRKASARAGSAKQ